MTHFPIEFTLRTILFCLAAYNVMWSGRGVVQVARGCFLPPYVLRCAVFFSNGSYVAYQVRYYIGVTDLLWTMLIISLAIISAILTIIAHTQSMNMKARQFYSLYDALPQALAIAELHKIDPTNADRLMNEAWNLLKAKVQADLNKAIPDG